MAYFIADRQHYNYLPPHTVTNASEKSTLQEWDAGTEIRGTAPIIMRITSA